jgi:hypothetical protein
MRKSLWIMLAILLVAIAAPNAHADVTPYGTYTVECLGPCASDPTVTIDSTRIDFTVFGNSVDITGLALTAGNLEGWNIDNGLLSITDVTSGVPVVAPISLTFPTSNEAGLFLPGTVPTPEPGSLGLMLLGVGLAFVLRKRVGQGLPQAS